jgi:glutathione reductase (NADPH)
LEYDLIVIGAGSGGVRAARMAAQTGKKVAVIEYQALGGTCVNVGCVPKKLFVYASHFAESFEDAQGFGWHVDKPQFSWQKLLKNKNAEILRLNGIYEKLLKQAGVDLIRGRAELVNKNEVQVADQVFQSKRILIASGSKAFIPEFEGNDLVITSNDMFYLETLPNKILIVGGGFIAVEFAGIMAGLGVDTTLVYRSELFLRGFDKDVREFLHKEMLKKGIKITFNERVKAIHKEADNLRVSFEHGSQEQVFDKVLYATGRTPNTDGLGLEKIGVILREGAIQVDKNFQTNIDSIYALGDVIGHIQLTPVAIEEAMVLVNQLYGDNSKTMNYENIPSAVFSQPNLASVGLTEEQAEFLVKENNFELEVYVSDFQAMKFSLSENTERTFMKLIINKSTQQVLGVHMVGDAAAEIIQGIAIAVKAGASKADFDATIGIHPSSAEEFVTMRTARVRVTGK